MLDFNWIHIHRSLNYIYGYATQDISLVKPYSWSNRMTLQMKTQSNIRIPVLPPVEGMILPREPGRRKKKRKRASTAKQQERESQNTL